MASRRAEKFVIPAVVILFAALVTSLAILCGGLFSAADPRTSTMNTSLSLDIPSDDHYTYICLQVGKRWSECVQMMQRGNVTLSITAERTKSETKHHLIVTAGLISLVEFGVLFILLLIWMCSLAACCECFICPKSISARNERKHMALRYTNILVTEDPEFWVIETPTALGLIRSRHQPEACPGPSHDNAYFEDSETVCYSETLCDSETEDSETVCDSETEDSETVCNSETEDSETVCDSEDSEAVCESKAGKGKVGNSCAVNITSQIDLSLDVGPEFIATVGGHVKELEAKIKASSYSSEAPLKPRTYDCFIIYSRDDEDFVYENLIPFFIRNNIKYCEHQEHFELGKNIFDNVNTCITRSRRVVAVLSRSFFDSGYCKMDLDAARGYAASNGYSVQDFLISIKITNVEFPPKYSDISNSTYADLSEDVDDERKWLQIRKALTEFRLASVTMRIDIEF
ncbi:TLR6 [Branchiostoma lanceolatum]|uniref:TLR6 protein n=1 Tax=Branchiostoma lanceolatum TaxID=7740 RepID=A0A8K0AIK9_BRALA|nr:TLR6 [Branchiostoma lanceolatum]